MAETLIIPDIHQKHKVAQRILDNHKDVDRVVFLGDYFDDFNDTPEQTAATAEWLKFHLGNPKYTFLFGNHDVQYYRPRPPFICSGFTWIKAHVINEIMTETDWQQLRLFKWHNATTLFTHAGLHPYFSTNDLLPAENALMLNQNHQLLDAGRGRGGYAKYGGVTWLDWNQEFKARKDVAQIVGHTPASVPRFDSNTWCLDTHLKHYAIIYNDGFVGIYGTGETYDDN